MKALSSLLKPLVLAALLTALVPALAAGDDETVPTTVEGGASTVKEGGKDIGEGFKGIGRGIRDVFTGESSKENFKEGKKIGTGVVDVGRGVGGMGRGVGREVKEGFKGDSSDTSSSGSTISEEKLD